MSFMRLLKNDKAATARRNIDQLKREVAWGELSEYTLKKINKMADRNLLSPDVYIDELMSGSVSAATLFSKAASKQNRSETLQKRYIEAGLPGTTLEMQSKARGRRFTMDNGNKTKSTDFTIGDNIFISAKALTSQGGAQENEVAEVKAFIRSVLEESVRTGEVLGAVGLLDVEFDIKSEEFMQTIPEELRNRVFIGNSDEFIDFIKQGKKWP